MKRDSLMQVLGIASYVSTALSVVAFVLLCARFGPDLAMLLAMYTGNLEPERPAAAFPWLVTALSCVPAGLLGWKGHYAWGHVACLFPALVCLGHLRELLTLTAGVP
jgi:hypothetical protein